MPHVDLHYSSELNVDALAVMKEVEAIILQHDDGSGETKGRAYPATVSNHLNMKVTVSLLSKPHRNAAFVAALQKDLVASISAHLPRPCWLSVDITFSTPNYFTEYLE